MKPGFFKRLAAAAPSKVAAAPDAYHDDWLHVENGVVMDMNGNEVWMTGVNWFGYNVGSQVFDGAWSANVHNCLKLISDHGFNLLRVPMSTQILLQWKNGEPDPIIKLNEYENPELKVEGVVGGTPMYKLRYLEEWISPLLMGEWGGFIDKENDPSGANIQWLTILRDYMTEKHIHHTFWCFNENSSDTGGLMYDNFQKWDDEKYVFVKPALWQDENGNFISLDHKIPLGKNGISLAQYCGGAPDETDALNILKYVVEIIDLPVK